MPPDSNHDKFDIKPPSESHPLDRNLIAGVALVVATTMSIFMYANSDDATFSDLFWMFGLGALISGYGWIVFSIIQKSGRNTKK
jgi:hypothetical protein